MALKGARVSNPYTHETTFFCDEVNERGTFMKYSSAGTGVALDDPSALVVKTTAANSTCAGMLVCDVVNKDLSQTHLNHHKFEVQKGGKVLLVRSGKWYTDKVVVSSAITAGTAAYLSSTGGSITDASSSATRVGTFTSEADADGFYGVSLDIEGTGTA